MRHKAAVLDRNTDSIQNNSGSFHQNGFKKMKLPQPEMLLIIQQNKVMGLFACTEALHVTMGTRQSS